MVKAFAAANGIKVSGGVETSHDYYSLAIRGMKLKSSNLDLQSPHKFYCTFCGETGKAKVKDIVSWSR